MPTNTVTRQVRWNDADPAGIVFYPRFFEWYDLGTESLFESLGLPWPDLFPRCGIIGVPIVESGSTFVSPVRYGDTIAIRSTVISAQERTFRMEHEIAVGERVCARGFEVRAWVAQPETPGGRLRTKPIPPDVLARLKEP